MHNQNRDTYKARQSDPGFAETLAQKAFSWNTLTQQLLASRRRIVQPDDAATQQYPHLDEVTCQKVSHKLLLVNPDPGYIWNVRRELIQFTELDTELQLTAASLQRNPKAYGAWFHRKWCIRHFCRSNADSNITQEVLDKELQLCTNFLNIDERNFHCWNFRRFIVGALASNLLNIDILDGSWEVFIEGLFKDSNKKPPTLLLMGPQLTSPSGKGPIVPNETIENGSNEARQLLIAVLHNEWTFTTQKIEQNFSNNSAFHYRSKLLPLICIVGRKNHGDDSIQDILTSEFQLVRNAFYTEPDDQTSWWYHRFLLDFCKPSATKADSELSYTFYRDALQTERTAIQDLVETEDGQCKWGWITLHAIVSRMIELIFIRNENYIALDVQNPNLTLLRQEAEQYLKKLIEIDPDRMCRYQDMLLDLTGN